MDNLIRIIGDELKSRIGEEISTIELVNECIKKSKDKYLFEYLLEDEMALLTLDYRLLQEAKERGIKLDCSKRKGKFGMPYALPFVIKTGKKNNPSFDSKINQIEEIVFETGGFFTRGESITIKFNGEKVIRSYLPFCVDGKETELIVKEIFDLPLGFEFDKELEISKNKFLESFKEVNVGLWARRPYLPTEEICDGGHWKLTIFYQDGEMRMYRGSNACPYTYDKLCNLLGCVDYDEE